jgi:hypothetical protein
MFLRLLVLVPIALAPVFAGDWQPLTAEERSMKKSAIDPDADAEILSWDVDVVDGLDGQHLERATSHHLRIKIFTERGKERYATVDIPLEGKGRITGVEGWTLKPDGSVLELKEDSIFERDVLKTKRLKIRVLSLALPNVGTGDVIEYRYRDTQYHAEPAIRLDLQREIPIRRVTYRLKEPLSTRWRASMRVMQFHCNARLETDRSGFLATSQEHVPAYHDEPDMPPKDEVMPWMLAYYERAISTNIPFELWRKVASEEYESFRKRMKAGKAVLNAAAEITRGIAAPEEKLQALDRFCRTRIRNVNHGPTAMTSQELKAFKGHASPEETLQRMAGQGSDINLLFAALAGALGFDARIALLCDREHMFFRWDRPLRAFLSSDDIAVKLGDHWLLFDPATPYLEPGMLRWQEEGLRVLISDPNEPVFVNTPLLPAMRSARRCRAELRLTEDGSLEGTVQYTFSGHTGREWKLHYQDLTAAEQEEDWKKGQQERVSGLELSDFEIKNVTDPLQPLIIRYKVYVPGYAARTGKRILLQPAFAEYNRPARYTASVRKSDLYYKFPWSEDDDVTIELPAGWLVDQPVQPVNLKAGTVGEYNADLLKTKDGRRLIYRRRFDWGLNGGILVDADNYGSVKKVFDSIQEQDAHTIALKQDIVAANTR